MKFFIFISWLLFGFCLNAYAQDEPFRGGSGDGFSAISVEEIFTEMSRGGSGDGYASDSENSLFNYVFKGSAADGYASLSYEDSFNEMFKGAVADAYASDHTINTFNDLFRGSKADGYTSDSSEDGFNDVFKGGVSDGFSSSDYGHIVVWTGIMGTGWNANGNWENGIIPTSCNPVIIPSAVPNFPFVNSGILKIGGHNNDGDYRCLQLKIENNAEMTTRVNCFVENRNLMIIRGKLFVKNPNPNAFVNLYGAEVFVKPSGELIILP